MRLKTTLLNKIHALAVSRGRQLKKERLGSKRGLKRVFEQDWTARGRTSGIGGRHRAVGSLAEMHSAIGDGN